MTSSLENYHYKDYKIQYFQKIQQLYKFLFSLVKDPSSNWPKYNAIGLTFIHWLLKLSFFLDLHFKFVFLHYITPFRFLPLEFSKHITKFVGMSLHVYVRSLALCTCLRLCTMWPRSYFHQHGPSGVGCTHATYDSTHTPSYWCTSLQNYLCAR